MRTNTLRVLTNAIEPLERRRLLSGGALDPGFGSQGLVITNSGSIVATLLQPDQKILALTGSSLIRYLPDGQLDSAFGSGGIAPLQVSGPIQVQLQSSGKIIVLTGNFVVARYLPNGAPDSSFGTNGQMTSWYGPPTQEAHGATDMIVMSDDRIRATGWCTWKVSMGYWFTGFVSTVVEAEGQNFGSGTTNLGDAYREDFASYSRQADGKILFAGQATETATGLTFVAVSRSNADGSPDMSFADGGRTMTRTGHVSLVRAAGQSSDGKVIVGGTSFDTANHDFWFARLNTDGASDPSFGTNGAMVVDLGSSDEGMSGLAVDDADRIVAGGWGWTAATGHDFALVRLTPSGQLDGGFGTEGHVLTDFANSDDAANDLLIQADQKILLAGGTGARLARYLADPSAVGAPDLVSDDDHGWLNNDNITNVTQPRFDISGVSPHATLTLFRDGVPVQMISDAAGGDVRIGDPGPVGDGTHLYTAQQSDPDGAPGPMSAPLPLAIDTVAPTDVEHAFHLYAEPMSVTMRWDTDVAVSPASLSLVNLTTGTTTTDGIALAYDTENRTATFTFPVFSHGVLPDGHYRATLSAGSVMDAAGNAMAADSAVTFQVLAGDADGNGVVNFDDYALIDNGFNNQLTGWANGDFDGNGMVNFDDYVLIDLAFNTQSGRW